MSKQRIVISAVAGIIIAAGLIYYFQRPIAIVGDWNISKADVHYRDQVVHLNFPEEKRSLGLYQLIKSMTNYQILKKYKVPVDEAQLQKEEERIEQNTKDPEQLQKVKDIFGKDHEAYQKIFILPNIVDHIIYYDLFLNDESIQQESLKAAADFIALASKDPKNFRAIGKSNKVLVRGLTLSLTKGMQWERDEKDKTVALPNKTDKKGIGGLKVIDESKNKSKVAQKFEADFAMSNSSVTEAQKWYDLLIKDMKEGEITPAPVNREEEWLVIRYVKKKSKDEHEIEVAFFKKLDFSAWLEKEKAQVPVRILDSSYVAPK